VWAGLFIVIGYASGMKLETMQQGLQMVSATAQGAIAVAIAAWGVTRLVAMRRARV
jgi:membrane protein DedA with SNARE-associated domain